MVMAAKRRRDPLSPRPILDRAALLGALKSEGIPLRNEGQVDLFYQLLHRSGYPPLKEFASELIGGGAVAADGNDDGSVIVASSSKKFRTKNAISSRPGRRTQLPKSFLSYLATTDDFATVTSKVQAHRTSSDGTTTKLAVELQDGHVVESVLMRHGSRVTICVSSQVGCAMGCTFCATGTMGIRGDLSSGEILEQLVHGSRILSDSYSPGDSLDFEVVGPDEVREASAKEGRKSKGGGRQRNDRLDLIRNVVFMGMGEPLNNYHSVLAACRAMIDRRIWNLAHSRVTVSTVGVPSKMRALTRDLPEVNLALSLHAPNQGMREKIVPAARGTPIESLIEALDGHMMALSARKRMALDNPQGSDGDGGSSINVNEFNQEERQSASKKKRAMIEYVMLEGDTSTIEAAHQLGRLCEGRHLVVNLIPYNKTDVEDVLSCPSEGHMQEFRRIVSSYGSFCTIRRTMGADIAGACGQLVVEREKKGKHDGVVDIEDGPFGDGENAVGRERRPVAAVISRRGKTDEVEGKNDVDVIGDPWVRRLTIATAIAATCFVTSSTLLLLQRRKR